MNDVSPRPFCPSVYTPPSSHPSLSLPKQKLGGLREFLSRQPDRAGLDGDRRRSRAALLRSIGFLPLAAAADVGLGAGEMTLYFWEQDAKEGDTVTSCRDARCRPRPFRPSIGS